KAAGLTSATMRQLPAGPSRDAIEAETNRRPGLPSATLSPDERIMLLAGIAALPGSPSRQRWRASAHRAASNEGVTARLPTEAGSGGQRRTGYLTRARAAVSSPAAVHHVRQTRWTRSFQPRPRRSETSGAASVRAAEDR